MRALTGLLVFGVLAASPAAARAQAEPVCDPTPGDYGYQLRLAPISYDVDVATI